ncbi:helix-turn-helix domain-containing protein [Nocardioides taihuensis]|uniref:Helix-turn-helix domain-containing protein n=1 Tax=Nocardioides taihuensis TaxID=1835606 RepID=A0ABW0BFU0_9ACTN
MAHANAALTPRHRLQLPRLIVDQGWPPSQAAEFVHVPWRTAAKWAQRYRDERPGWPIGLGPHTQHARTPAPAVRKIVHRRWQQRLGPVS